MNSTNVISGTTSSKSHPSAQISPYSKIKFSNKCNKISPLRVDCSSHQESVTSLTTRISIKLDELYQLLQAPIVYHSYFVFWGIQILIAATPFREWKTKTSKFPIEILELTSIFFQDKKTNKRVK